MSSSCRKAVAGVLAAVAASQVSAQVVPGTAGLEFQPRIQVGALHDDNYRLTDVRGAEVEVTGALVDAELALRSEDPRGLIEFLPRVRSTFFPGEEAEESTDWFIGAGWQRRSQRLETRAEALYSKENVLTSELLSAEFPDVDLGDTVAGDGGRVQVRNRRHLLRLAPQLTYAWTPTRRVDAGVTYIDASFDTNFVQQTGFKDVSAFGGIEVDTTQRDTLSGRLKAGNYDPDTGSADTDRYGVEGEWRRRWSQTTQVYLRAGVDQTETEILQRQTPTSPLVPVSISETSVIGGLGVQWDLEVTQFIVDAVRSTSPSSAGVVTTRDEFRARVRRELRPRLAAFANLRLIRSEGALEDQARAVVSDRDYLTGKAGVQWRMTRQIEIVGAYDYARQEFEGEPTGADSNALSLTFVYEPRRRD
jgi:hypothetical protein